MRRRRCSVGYAVQFPHRRHLRWEGHSLFNPYDDCRGRVDVTNDNQPKIGRIRRHAKDEEQGERGAILILALAYITVIGVIVAALTTWASGDLNNTNNFTSARNLDYSLSSAMEVAMNNIRYAPEADSVNASTPVACWGSGTSSTYELPNSTNNIATWCSTQSDPGTSQTRTVTIYACIYTTYSASQCAANPQLQAVIVFDDYSDTGQPANGEGATLESWDWSSKAGLSVALPNSISVLSTPPAIPLVGGTYQTSASAVSGDTVVVSSSAPSICRVSGSVVTFVANGNCTIYFNDSGNVNYQGVTTNSVFQTMTVGPLANTITVNSAQPTSATVGGSTYTPVASATSGDVVAVTSATTSVCTVSSGVVTFIGAGTGTATCTLDFNDPGNTDYVAATQVTQSFSVTVGVPAGVSILAYSSTPNGSPNNGDQVTYTYNQTMNGSSLLSGFSGSSTAVYVQLSRSNGSPTSWKVCGTSNCSTVVSLGTVGLGDGGTPGYYVATAGNTVYYNATMSMSTVSGESVVTVVLGSTVSGSASALNPTTTQTTLAWTPSASATGTANETACSTAVVTEANAPQRNF
jgi:hypothetical protein